MDKNYKPVYAEASGNTFLIFDYLDKYEHDFDESVVRYFHRLYGFEKIDSCLVLTKVSNESVPAHLRDLKSSLLLRMYVYEPGDGYCGNGARAVAKYCFNYHKNSYEQFFIILDGQSHQLLQQDTEYFAEMGKSIYDDPNGGFVKKGVLNSEGKLITDDVTWYYVNTSEPHLVTLDKIDDEKLTNIGNSLQDPKRFPIGINLNKVSVVDKSTIDVVTFERGINRITLACGTGSTSCAALVRRLGFIDKAINKVTVKVRGGYVIVSNENDKIYLGGQCAVEGVDDIEPPKI
ncbi:19962_t:CDS:1 [Gigaspora margarita]|uniref:Diaminopimelate epimerase n=2 Tax=Gigaspora margarita TaxID=4874 RepID=A0A8H4EMZ1_GIGMA|nr:diaminopimelate epimerase [Gigaspora margarita]CAG8778458.1 19962_t:CDS:1 [Gigaspora margarita]